MPLIRSILHLLWMTVTVIPWGLAVLVFSLFGSSTQIYWLCAGWLRLAVSGGTVILGIKNRVTGMENLPTGETSAAVLLLKHQSTWETFSMPTLMPHPLAYVFKKEVGSRVTAAGHRHGQIPDFTGLPAGDAVIAAPRPQSCGSDSVQALCQGRRRKATASAPISKPRPHSGHKPYRGTHQA